MLLQSPGAVVVHLVVVHPQMLHAHLPQPLQHPCQLAPKDPPDYQALMDVKVPQGRPVVPG